MDKCRTNFAERFISSCRVFRSYMCNLKKSVCHKKHQHGPYPLKSSKGLFTLVYHFFFNESRTIWDRPRRKKNGAPIMKAHCSLQFPSSSANQLFVYICGSVTDTEACRVGAFLWAIVLSRPPPWIIKMAVGVKRKYIISSYSCKKKKNYYSAVCGRRLKTKFSELNTLS